MKKNMNTADRMIRIALAIVFVLLVVNNGEDVLIKVAGTVLSFYAGVTALFGICLLYTVCKVSTKAPRKRKNFY